MGFNNVYRQFSGKITGETEKAIRLEFCIDSDDRVESDEHSYKSEWFPFSQLKSIHRLSKPDNNLCDILMVSEWILKQKGILHLAGITTPPVIEAPKKIDLRSLADKLKTPPVPNFSDMDDDIPF